MWVFLNILGKTFSYHWPLIIFRAERLLAIFFTIHFLFKLKIKFRQLVKKYLRNVAPVLNLAQCQTFASFRPYCIVLPLFWCFRGLEQCRNVCGTDFDLEGVEILAKMMQNG